MFVECMDEQQKVRLYWGVFECEGCDITLTCYATINGYDGCAVMLIGCIMEWCLVGPAGRAAGAFVLACA